MRDVLNYPIRLNTMIYTSTTLLLSLLILFVCAPSALVVSVIVCGSASPILARFAGSTYVCHVFCKKSSWLNTKVITTRWCWCRGQPSSLVMLVVQKHRTSRIDALPANSGSTKLVLCRQISYNAVITTIPSSLLIMLLILIAILSATAFRVLLRYMCWQVASVLLGLSIIVLITDNLSTWSVLQNWTRNEGKSTTPRSVKAFYD